MVGSFAVRVERGLVFPPLFPVPSGIDSPTRGLFAPSQSAASVIHGETTSGLNSFFKKQ